MIWDDFIGQLSRTVRWFDGFRVTLLYLWPYIKRPCQGSVFGSATCRVFSFGVI